MSSARRTLSGLRGQESPRRASLVAFADACQAGNLAPYSRWHRAGTERCPRAVPEVKAVYPETPELLPGSDVVALAFDKLMARDPRVFVIGEDVGRLGGVNQE